MLFLNQDAWTLVCWDVKVKLLAYLVGHDILVILLKAIYFLIENYMEIFKSTTNVDSLENQNNYAEQNGKKKDSLPPVNNID